MNIFQTIFKSESHNLELPDEWNQLLSDFHTYLLIEKNYSPHTILNYFTDLYYFFEYLQKMSLDPLNLDSGSIRSYFASMNEKQKYEKKNSET